MIEIIGHRGYAARAPENTLASLELAIEAGADAVEWDVRVASCGTPVLFHDATLGRTTDGVGPLRRRSLEQLRALDAGRWFSDAFAGERIPSLEGALKAVRGRVSRVYCEIKEYRELEDLDRMVAVCRDTGMHPTVTFISLDRRVVEHIAGGDPTTRIGFVVDDAEVAGDAVKWIGTAGRGFLDAEAGMLVAEPAVTREALDAGVEVGAWTVNDPETAEELAARGVTRFTTDEVERLVEWRRRRGDG